MQIWLPGRGLSNTAEVAVDNAVREYDERLFFARNGETGDWCIFLKMPRGEDPFPLLGFQTIPHPEDALQRLWKADTLRHGEKILNNVRKSHENYKTNLQIKADESIAEVSERLEFEMRKNAKTKTHHWTPVR